MASCLSVCSVCGVDTDVKGDVAGSAKVVTSGDLRLSDYLT